ncbi:MAG: hypothetical protein NTW86_16230 [Candidatus Sumerlaeota bacterium]|nr:hypothetical protein [Candidatus Sumerlaeota bacterium]
MILWPTFRGVRLARAGAGAAAPFFAMALFVSPTARAADSAETKPEAAANTAEPAFQQLVSRASAAPPESPIDPKADPIRAYRVSPEAIRVRKDAVVDAVKQLNPGKSKNGKYSLRAVLPRLLRDPADAASLAAIESAVSSEEHDSFAEIYLAQVYGRFGASLPASLRDVFRAQAEAYPKFLGGGTENMVGMERVAAMVFGEAFPEMKTSYGMPGRDVADQAVQWMRRYGKEVYRWSMSEYLSPIYLGVHNEIWLTANEYAHTDAARLMSRAMLDWIWTDLAVNSHLGQVLPPQTRAKSMHTRGPQMTYPNTHTQWLSWLYWGDERSRPGREDLPPYMAQIKPNMPVNEAFGGFALGLQSAVIPAVSEEYPNEIIRNIGAKRVRTPYRLLQSRVNFGALIGAGDSPAAKMPAMDAIHRYNLRSVYVAKDYAIGAGYFRQHLQSENLMHLMPMGIVYQSDDPLNLIFLSHPYWYTALQDERTGNELGLDDWLGHSPFEQSVHWDNAILTLYDIPEADPYLGAAIGTKNEKWLSERSPKCIRAACLYVPATIDEKRQTPWGWLLREKDVYIAVRPFGVERAEWQTCDHPVQAGYERLVLYGALMGVAIEVGDRGEYGTPDAFAQKVGQAALDLSTLSQDKEARYVSSRGASLRLGFAADGGFPRAWVDGAALDFENWPVCESPYVTCRNGVLDVNDGAKGFTVDWSGDYPAYTYYDLANGARHATGSERLEQGSMKKK